MKNIYHSVFLVLIISVIIGCSAAPPSVKEEPAQSEAVTAPAPVVEPVKEPEPKETMPSVKQEPAKPTVPVKPAEPKQEAPVRKEEPPAKAKEPSVKPEPVAAKKEPVVAKKEPAAKVKPAPVEKKQEVIAEFEGVTITKETYDQTKTEMEKIVENLNRITASKDYSQWLKLLSEEYKQQYSQALTLQKVSEALPVKGIKLKSLRDYFIYVFVPSRQNVRVDDIKFVSPTRVDVIMKQANVSLLVYGLENIDGTWKLIPPKL